MNAEIHEAAQRRLEQRLRGRFAPQELSVRDESAAHAGHAGHRGQGGKHYRVRIVSGVFSGLKPLARHRLVHETLADLLEGEIHALALETLSPDEAPGARR